MTGSLSDQNSLLPFFSSLILDSFTPETGDWVTDNWPLAKFSRSAAHANGIAEASNCTDRPVRAWCVRFLIRPAIVIVWPGVA